MYYFYIIKPKNRVGFGIATDPSNRLQKYISHVGDDVKFSYLYGGLRTKTHSLERTIKKENTDKLWQIETWSKVWKTEWLNEDVTLEEFKEYVDTLISERHLDLKLIAKDFSITQELRCVNSTTP